MGSDTSTFEFYNPDQAQHIADQHKKRKKLHGVPNTHHRLAIAKEHMTNVYLAKSSLHMSSDPMLRQQLATVNAHYIGPQVDLPLMVGPVHLPYLGEGEIVIIAIF